MSNTETNPSDESAAPLLDDLLESQMAEPYLIHLLFRSFRNLQAMIQPSLQARGHQGIGLAETRLLLALDEEGTRINILAERIGTSRQFTSRVVHELNERGYIQIIPDPQDGRAILVKLEARGRQYFQDMQVVKQALDGELMARMGEERLTALIETLQELIRHTTQHDLTWQQNIDPK